MKTTDELMKQLNSASDLLGYLAENDSEFTDISLSEYLNSIMEKKDLKPTDVINGSNLMNIYVYKILSGERMPSRDKLLALCFGLHMDLNETQAALRFASHSLLYPRVRRDSIIIFALDKGAGLMECNEMLYDLNEQIIE